MAGWRRTHTCGELRENHVGQTVVLNGWVHTYRNQGSLVFIDLRDRYGLTQVVFEPEQENSSWRQRRNCGASLSLPSRAPWRIACRVRGIPLCQLVRLR